MRTLTVTSRERLLQQFDATTLRRLLLMLRPVAPVRAAAILWVAGVVLMIILADLIVSGRFG